jgi:hypothetical protein
MTKYYKISESDLLELLQRDHYLDALEAAGVDNWDDGDGVSEFLEEYPEPEAEDIINIYDLIESYDCAQCGNNVNTKKG